MFELVKIGIWDGQDICSHLDAIEKINPNLRIKVVKEGRSLILKYEAEINGKKQKFYACITAGDSFEVPRGSNHEDETSED